MKQSLDIFGVAKNAGFNKNLALVRFLLAAYVFFFHLLPRYAFYHSQTSILLDVEMALIRCFQFSNETNPAVIAFITLSGYCIHRNGFRHGEIEVTPFLIKRFMRIFPMVLLGSVVGIITFFLFKSDPRIFTLTNTKQISLSGLMYKLSGIFAFIPYKFEELTHQANGPLITCIIEFYLYCFYPLGAIAIRKWNNINFFCILLIINLLGATICYLYPHIHSWWHNGSLLAFLIYWWIGAYAVGVDNFVYKYGSIITVSFVLLSLILILHPNLVLLVEAKKILLALNVARLLRWSDMQKFDVPGIVWRGTYSLYILHVPLICWALFLGVSMGWAVLAIFAIAHLSYTWIERPAYKLGERIAKSWKENLAWAAISLNSWVAKNVSSEIK